MWKGSLYLDLLIQKCQLMTSKALIPILRLVDDINTQPKRHISDYHESLHDSLRLLTASFNSLSQARKDVIKTTFHDSHVSKLCTWDTPVGTDYLFDFDVVAKVDALTKTKGLRATLRKKRKVSSSHFKRAFNHSPYHSTFKRPYYSYQPQPQPHSSRDYYRPYRNGGQNARKPFLGRIPKKSKNSKPKDRQ